MPSALSYDILRVLESSARAPVQTVQPQSSVEQSMPNKAPQQAKKKEGYDLTGFFMFADPL